MDLSERLLVAGKHLGKCLAGYRDNDLRSAARGAADLAELILNAADEIDRLRIDLLRAETALEQTKACPRTKDTP